MQTCAVANGNAESSSDIVIIIVALWPDARATGDELVTIVKEQ